MRRHGHCEHCGRYMPSVSAYKKHLQDVHQLVRIKRTVIFYAKAAKVSK